MVKVTEELSVVLDILTVEFKSVDASLERVPSIVKFPASASASLTTSPSGSFFSLTIYKPEEGILNTNSVLSKFGFAL